MRSRLATLAALALLAAGVGACGDDGDGGGPSGAVLDATADIVSVGDADEGIDGVEAFRITSAEHTEDDVDYGVAPPPGGPHHPTWANCGFHEQEIRQEHIVHTMEHGAVWVAYDADLPQGDLDAIDALAGVAKVIAAPYPELADGEAVVVTAWARQLRLDAVDDERLEEFVSQYQDGDQAPEAGVTCTGTDVP